MLKKTLEEKPNSCEFLPAWGFLAAIFAQAATLQKLNSRSLHAPVPWDQLTGFPSHPTLIADAVKYADFLEKNDPLRIILSSFREWTLFCKEKVQCKHDSEAKIIDCEVLLNHTIARENNALAVKQLVCAKSDNKRHLERHYGSVKPTKAYGESTNIIWTASNKILASDEEQIKIESFGIETSNMFSEVEFGKRLIAAIKSTEAI